MGVRIFLVKFKNDILFRARTQAGAQIKSWRVWVLWVDGDWTCETMKSFSPHQVEQIQQRVRRGTDIWPWPEGNSPKDMYRRNELKGRNMVCCIFIFTFLIFLKHLWQDAAAGKRWISIPQNERQDDDDDKDLPNEKDSLFMIQAQPAEESTTETADSDDSTDDDEEEDEI